MQYFHAVFAGWLFALLSSSVLWAETALAEECTCQQHNAKADGDSACSRTETNSYCTISFGSSAETRPRVREFLEYGVIQGETGAPSSLSPFVEGTVDPVEVAYRVVELVGRPPSDFDLRNIVPNAGEYFTTALMINFALSALQQEDTIESFAKAMTMFFDSAEKQDQENILDAFTTGKDTEMSFDSSTLVVRYGCAALTYGDSANTVVVANEKGQGACD